MCHNLGVERYGLFCSFNIVCLLDKPLKLAGIQLWKHFPSGRSEYGLRPKDTVNDMISRAFSVMIGRKLSMHGKEYSGLIHRCAVPGYIICIIFGCGKPVLLCPLRRTSGDSNACMYRMLGLSIKS